MLGHGVGDNRFDYTFNLPSISQKIPKIDDLVLEASARFLKPSIIEHNARVSDDVFEQNMERTWTRKTRR